MKIIVYKNICCDAHWKRLHEILPMRTHSMFLQRKKKNRNLDVPQYQEIKIYSLHSRYLSCAYFSNLNFSKSSFRYTMRVSNSLDPDKARHVVGPNLGPNCLQKLSADDTSRQIIVG